MHRSVALLGCLAVVLASACSTPPSAARSEVRPASPAPARLGMPSPVPAEEARGTPARFEGAVVRIWPALRERLIGRNWHAGCPVPIEDLRLVRVTYWNFRGHVRTGPLVLHEDVAADVLWVFRRLFHASFRIQRIALAAKWRPPRPSDYWDESRRSVTASFNCRPATDSTSLSQHSFGWAIDINPLQNPYVRGDGSVLRAVAEPYRDRTRHRRGMILPGSIVVRVFGAIGWGWGGDWHTLKDYMHFSLTGR